jgi:diguanylate cyclase (GGDEF)-like protein
MAKIAVIDDLAVNRELLVNLVQAFGHESVEASNGAEALELVRREQPDLVICDILMPVMDGYEFVRHLRADPQIGHIPVVFFTAYYLELEAQQLAQACGVTEILTKPYEPEQIIAVIERVLASTTRADAQANKTPPPLLPSFERQHLRLMTDKLSEKVVELQSSNTKLAALIELNLQLGSQRDAARLLDQICNSACSMLGASYASIAVRNAENHELAFVCHSGLAAEVIADLGQCRFDQGLLGTVVAERESCRVARAEAEKSSLGLPVGYPPVCSLVAAPVVSLTAVYGWIFLANKLGADEFSKDDERTLGIIAAQTGRIYENGALYHKIEKHSTELEEEIVEREQVQARLAAQYAVARILAEAEAGNLEEACQQMLASICRNFGFAAGTLWRCSEDGRSVHCFDIWCQPDEACRSFVATTRHLTLATDVCLPGKVLASGSLVWVSDVIDDPAFHRRIEAAEAGIHAGTALPIGKRRGKITGVAEFFCRERREPDLGLIDMLEALGDQIGQFFERNQQQQRILCLTRGYAVLSGINSAIVRIHDRLELFREACRIAVEEGKFRMAWIGMVDSDKNMFSSVASFGSGTEYLDGIEISLDPNSPATGGPGYMSIREGQPFWIQDFQHDPTTAHWHERAARYDWGASASLPLFNKGVPVGVFGIYSGDTNVFDESMQKLLIEMSTDISFALDNFDKTAERNQALEKIKYQNTVLQTQQETSLDAILIVDENGTIISYNRQFIDLWRLPETLVSSRIDAPVMKFVLDQIEDAEAFAARVQYLYEHHGEKSSEEILLKDGRILDRYSAPVVGAHDEYYGRVWYFRNITDRKRAEERISYLANFDALTGLPNRAKLADHLKYAISLAKRRSGHFAMMFIDIDRFKDINDSLGHSIGDALLVEIARRLQSILREEDTAARFGGDEFVLMMPDGDSQGAAQVAKRLLQIVSEPYRIEQFDLIVTASIGIAIYPEDGADMESLFRNADTAMYQAKHEGRAGYRFYTAEMQSFVSFQMKLINALRTALELDQFQIHYQPQISLHDGRIIGAEALLRWSNPELGNVSPAVFIPVAEDAGLILPIGEWVMRTAVKQLKHWIDIGLPPFIIAVNLSAVQFRHPSLPDMVTGILNEAQLPPEYLELELTEGVAMHDPLEAISTMDHLHELGIHMSIDDFGTGYSSLNYLKKFKVYKLKIDQSFVRDISTDQEDKAIVAAIISMSKSLGLQTIAEGVETAEQLAYLGEQGCDEAQGYFFSKPLATEQMEAFLADNKSLVSFLL